MPNTALTGITADWDRLRDSVDDLSSVRGTDSLEVKETQQKLATAPVDISNIVGTVTAHNQCSRDTERR